MSQFYEPASLAGEIQKLQQRISWLERVVSQPLTIVSSGGVPTSLTADVSTPVVFNSEQFDRGGLFDPTNPTRLTVPEGIRGTYLIEGFVGVTFTGAGLRAGHLYRNLTNMVQTSFDSYPGNTIGCPLSTIIDLEEGDYIEVQAVGNGSASGNAQARVCMLRVG